MTLPLAIGAATGLLLAAAYTIIISKYLHGWRTLPGWSLPQNFLPKTTVSVIVPARNEAGNILACLQSLASQNFPPELFEVIVVDDHSTDGTAELVTPFFSEGNPKMNLRLLRLADFAQAKETQSFKKKAIELAIEHATGHLIATTDADCETPPDWLALLISFYENSSPVFIAAPVNFHHEKSLLERFQSLDFLGMMGVTGAGIHLGWANLCNGANLAYPKAAFHAVGGFAGTDHLASGDDVLLLQKMAAHFPGQIGFLKNPAATVRTAAKPDLRSFLSQRLRWATKSGSYRERAVTGVLAVVLLFCLAIVGSAVLAPVLGWPWLLLALFLLLVKTGADYFFLREMARYFGRQDLMRSFFASQILHIGYIVTVGVLGNLKKKYAWKGRQVR